MKWNWEDIIGDIGLVLASIILFGTLLFSFVALVFVLFGKSMIKIVLFLLACWAIGKGIGWWQRRQKGR